MSYVALLLGVNCSVKICYRPRKNKVGSAEDHRDKNTKQFGIIFLCHNAVNQALYDHPQPARGCQNTLPNLFPCYMFIQSDQIWLQSLCFFLSFYLQACQHMSAFVFINLVSSIPKKNIVWFSQSTFSRFLQHTVYCL